MSNGLNLEAVKSMGEDDLNWALSVISQEIASRRELAAIPAKIEKLNREYLNATGVEEGAEWVQPTGAHDAYPQDWEVNHGGKRWRSLTPANVWEPGVSGWREVLPEPEPVEPDPENPEAPEVPAGPSAAQWVQPTGGHDAYGVGDRVQHNGAVWVSSTPANVWEPGVYGWTQAS